MYNWGHCLISGSLQFTVYSFLEFPSILDFCPDLFFSRYCWVWGLRGLCFQVIANIAVFGWGEEGGVWFICKGNIVVVF